MDWKIGMKCWVEYCNVGGFVNVKLCKIIDLRDWESTTGKTHKIAILRFIEPILDGGELVEITSRSLSDLDYVLEIKRKQHAEILDVFSHNNGLSCDLA